MRTGRAELPLHTGKAPRWLFARMRRLAGATAEILVEDRGPGELLRRLADPCWFQAFGCVLGFDWHSSGLTTTACGALKEGLKARGKDLGIWAAGGKGRAGRRTPEEIARACEACGADPARFSFAHGGKDGTPFPVDLRTYDRSIELLGRCLGRARVESSDRQGAFRRLDALRRAADAAVRARGAKRC